MAMARRRQERQRVIDLVSIAFGDSSKMDLSEYLENGRIIQWSHHPAPATPGLVEAKRKLREANQKLLETQRGQPEVTNDEPA